MVASSRKNEEEEAREGEDEDNQDASPNHWSRLVVKCPESCSGLAVTHRRIVDIGGALPAKTSDEEKKEERPGRHENEDKQASNASPESTISFRHDPRTI